MLFSLRWKKYRRPPADVDLVWRNIYYQDKRDSTQIEGLVSAANNLPGFAA